MIIIENTAVSVDIVNKMFVCELNKCKGACCVEGDAGAPLELEELAILEDIFDEVLPYLSENGKKAIAEKGLYEVDQDGDFCTTTVGNRECVFAIYDKGILKCGIEQAYLDKKTDFKKPISCHLYPIRISKTDHYMILNYSKWNICAPACSNGAELGVPIYKFLKEPLIRKFGAEWYAILEQYIASKLYKL